MRPNETYHNLDEAFEFYNDLLFDSKLNPCLITFSRKARMYGYYRRESFCSRHSDDYTDEISLNPLLFEGRSDEEILSTLVHEMVHQYQYQFGTPSRTGYHNNEWAEKMEEIGLVPSDTGQPEGKRVGQRMSHYINDTGLFARATKSLFNGGFQLTWQARPESKKTKKPTSKIKFTCPECKLNAWAKPTAKLMCQDCRYLMIKER